MEELETWGLDASHTLAKLAAGVGRAFLDAPVARAAVRIRDHYYDQLGDALPQPYAVWLTRVTQLLVDGQPHRSISPTLDRAATASVIVASFYGVQEMSSRLNTRARSARSDRRVVVNDNPVIGANNMSGRGRLYRGPQASRNDEHLAAN